MRLSPDDVIAEAPVLLELAPPPRKRPVRLHAPALRADTVDGQGHLLAVRARRATEAALLRHSPPPPRRDRTENKLTRGSRLCAETVRVTPSAYELRTPT